MVSRTTSLCLALVALFSVSANAHAQTGFLERYQARVSASEDAQPHWATPLVTSTPRLAQDIKGDFVRESQPGGHTTWNFGNSRGLDLIPERHIQLSFNAPPFFEHSAPNSRDGFGDVTFALRYRVWARPERHGNAIFTPLLSASVPTGKNGNGSCCAVVTPSLLGGKGFGRFAFMGQAGASLPVTNATGLGHTLTFNGTAEANPKPGPYGRFLWVQMETNTYSYVGGSNDGKTQSFVTPGVLLGSFPLTPLTHDPGHRRVGLTLGLGEQIAVTRFHTYNHAAIFAFRLPF